jgi:hypothetical protein
LAPEKIDPADGIASMGIAVAMVWQTLIKTAMLRRLFCKIYSIYHA